MRRLLPCCSIGAACYLLWLTATRIPQVASASERARAAGWEALVGDPKPRQTAMWREEVGPALATTGKHPETASCLLTLAVHGSPRVGGCAAVNTAAVRLLGCWARLMFAGSVAEGWQFTTDLGLPAPPPPASGSTDRLVVLVPAPLPGRCDSYSWLFSATAAGGRTSARLVGDLGVDLTVRNVPAERGRPTLELHCHPDFSSDPAGPVFTFARLTHDGRLLDLSTFTPRAWYGEQAWVRGTPDGTLEFWLER